MTAGRVLGLLLSTHLPVTWAFTTHVSRIRNCWEISSPRSWRILVSTTNGASYTEVWRDVNGSLTPACNVRQNPHAPGTGIYSFQDIHFHIPLANVTNVRYETFSRNSQWGMSLYEAEVYDDNGNKVDLIPIAMTSMERPSNPTNSLVSAFYGTEYCCAAEFSCDGLYSTRLGTDFLDDQVFEWRTSATPLLSVPVIEAVASGYELMEPTLTRPLIIDPSWVEYPPRLKFWTRKFSDIFHEYEFDSFGRYGEGNVLAVRQGQLVHGPLGSGSGEYRHLEGTVTIYPSPFCTDGPRSSNTTCEFDLFKLGEVAKVHSVKDKDRVMVATSEGLFEFAETPQKTLLYILNGSFINVFSVDEYRTLLVDEDHNAYMRHDDKLTQIETDIDGNITAAFMMETTNGDRLGFITESGSMHFPTYEDTCDETEAVYNAQCCDSESKTCEDFQDAYQPYCCPDVFPTGMIATSPYTSAVPILQKDKVYSVCTTSEFIAVPLELKPYGLAIFNFDGSLRAISSDYTAYGCDVTTESSVESITTYGTDGVYISDVTAMALSETDYSKKPSTLLASHTWQRPMIGSRVPRTMIVNRWGDLLVVETRRGLVLYKKEILDKARLERGLVYAASDENIVMHHRYSPKISSIDIDGTFYAEVVENSTIFNHGLAMRCLPENASPIGGASCWIFMSTSDSVFAFEYDDTTRESARKPLSNGFAVVSYMSNELDTTALLGGGHSTREIVFMEDDSLLIAVGSISNIDKNDFRARVRRCSFTRWTTALRNKQQIPYRSLDTYAHGLRNIVGMTVDSHGIPWGVNMGMDNVNDEEITGFQGNHLYENNPPCSVHKLFPGFSNLSYGYPECWLSGEPLQKGNKTWPRGTTFSENRMLRLYNISVSDDACRDPSRYVGDLGAAIRLTAHSSPISIVLNIADPDDPHLLANDGHCARHVTKRKAFPGSFASITLHGSWNRETRSGYKVVKVELDNPSLTSWIPEGRLETWENDSFHGYTGDETVEDWVYEDTWRTNQPRPDNTFRPAGQVFGIDGELYIAMDNNERNGVRDGCIFSIHFDETQMLPPSPPLPPIAPSPTPPPPTGTFSAAPEFEETLPAHFLATTIWPGQQANFKWLHSFHNKHTRGMEYEQEQMGAGYYVTIKSDEYRDHETHQGREGHVPGGWVYTPMAANVPRVLHEISSAPRGYSFSEDFQSLNYGSYTSPTNWFVSSEAVANRIHLQGMPEFVGEWNTAQSVEAGLTLHGQSWPGLVFPTFPVHGKCFAGWRFVDCFYQNSMLALTYSDPTFTTWGSATPSEYRPYGGTRAKAYADRYDWYADVRALHRPDTNLTYQFNAQYTQVSVSNSSITNGTVTLISAFFTSNLIETIAPNIRSRWHPQHPVGPDDSPTWYFG